MERLGGNGVDFLPLGGDPVFDGGFPFPEEIPNTVGRLMDGLVAVAGRRFDSSRVGKFPGKF